MWIGTKEGFDNPVITSYMNVDYTKLTDYLYDFSNNFIEDCEHITCTISDPSKNFIEDNQNYVGYPFTDYIRKYKGSNKDKYTIIPNVSMRSNYDFNATNSYKLIKKMNTELDDILKQMNKKDVTSVKEIHEFNILNMYQCIIKELLRTLDVFKIILNIIIRIF